MFPSSLLFLIFTLYTLPIKSSSPPPPPSKHHLPPYTDQNPHSLLPYNSNPLNHPVPHSLILYNPNPLNNPPPISPPPPFHEICIDTFELLYYPSSNSLTSHLYPYSLPRSHPPKIDSQNKGSLLSFLKTTTAEIKGLSLDYEIDLLELGNALGEGGHLGTLEELGVFWFPPPQLVEIELIDVEEEEEEDDLFVLLEDCLYLQSLEITTTKALLSFSIKSLLNPSSHSSLESPLIKTLTLQPYLKSITIQINEQKQDYRWLRRGDKGVKPAIVTWDETINQDGIERFWDRLRRGGVERLEVVWREDRGWRGWEEGDWEWVWRWRCEEEEGCGRRSLEFI